MTISESFRRFQYYLILKQIFWKPKTFFKKLGYRILVEVTKIENTSFPFKTALLEANAKANRIASTKWTYQNSGVFPVTTYFFWKTCSVLEPLKKS